ncbi:MAG: hypothetical protein JST30_13940 [Armatimonadetes bacterium]|nr:hypothetical protein [Armatimonadota bacterium]
MPTRREFLAQSALAATALTVAPLARGQEKKIVLGSGSHRYEWVPDWLVPPSTIKYGDTHGLAQDSKGRIYLSHTVHPTSESADGVLVFDEKGKFLSSWGPQFKGGSHGLDIRKEGKEEVIYHCDTNRRNVSKTTLDGKVLWEMGLPEQPGVYKDGAPYIPTNVAFSPNGDFYVADGYGSNWIHHYDIKGEWIRTFGGPGKEPGKVQQPHGIWLDPRGKEPMLVVADRANRRLQYFSLDGRHVKFVTDGMRLPCHFSVRGHELLVPDLESIVTVLDEDNKVAVQLGDGAPTDLRGHPRSDFVPGKFIHPHDAVFLRNGDILVAEWVPIGRVTLLKRLR